MKSSEIFLTVQVERVHEISCEAHACSSDSCSIENHINCLLRQVTVYVGRVYVCACASSEVDFSTNQRYTRWFHETFVHSHSHSNSNSINNKWLRIILIMQYKCTYANKHMNKYRDMYAFLFSFSSPFSFFCFHIFCSCIDWAMRFNRKPYMYKLTRTHAHMNNWSLTNEETNSTNRERTNKRNGNDGQHRRKKKDGSKTKQNKTKQSKAKQHQRQWQRRQPIINQ